MPGTVGSAPPPFVRRRSAPPPAARARRGSSWRGPRRDDRTDLVELRLVAEAGEAPRRAGLEPRRRIDAGLVGDDEVERGRRDFGLERREITRRRHVDREDT